MMDDKTALKVQEEQVKINPQSYCSGFNDQDGIAMFRYVKYSCVQLI